MHTEQRSKIRNTLIPGAGSYIRKFMILDQLLYMCLHNSSEITIKVGFEFTLIFSASVFKLGALS